MSWPGWGAAPPLWRLEARPDALVRAGVAWRDIARSARSVGTRTDRAAQTLLQVWEGEAAKAYAEHERRTSNAFGELSTVAETMAVLLDDGASVMRLAQHHLDDSWAATRGRIAALAPASGDPALDPAQRELLRAGAAEARQIRARTAATLATLADELESAQRRLSDQSVLLDDQRLASTGWLDLPDRGPAGAVILDGSRAVINATGSHDTIRVSVDRMTGEQLVEINGAITRLPPGLDLVVRSGGGNDTITVAPGSRIRVTLLGGTGDDTLSGGDGDDRLLGLWGRDTLAGGNGDDQLSGGAGRDYLDGQGGADRLAGGVGDDTLYGLDGDDRLHGGEGRDYLDGGAGDDASTGGSDADVVTGGRGADLLAGGSGDDTLYAGDGHDQVSAGDRGDRAYVQSSDDVSGTGQAITVELSDVGGNIRVEGTADFVARVRSDLDALRSSPRGAQMLAAIVAAQADHPAVLLPGVGPLFQGDTLVLRATDDPNGYTRWPDFPVGPTGAVVEYNPTFDDLKRGPTPPVVVLYHELAHVYDAFYRTSADGTYVGADNYGVDNAEREAVGLPIDADNDPSTPDELYPDHPYPLTENGLREEMGLAPRTYY